MSVLTLFRRLRGSVRTSAFEHSMDAELRHHLELETEALIASRHGAGGGARHRAAALRQRRAGQGRLPRVVGHARHRHAGAGRPLRAAQPAQVPVLHRGRAADAGARHRRQHRDLQRRPRRAAAAAALRQRRPADRSPAAGAEDRRRQRRRLGEGDRRLPRADRRRSTPSSSTTRCRSTCSGAARRRGCRPASSRPISSTSSA